MNADSPFEFKRTFFLRIMGWIDRRRYHKVARKLLRDSFFWDCMHDFAPHGNDTGADLLNFYRDWLKSQPGGDPLVFYQQLMDEWEMDETIEHHRHVLDEGAIAIAYAELKLRGQCGSDVKALAKAAIMRQREAAIQAESWPHKDERLRTLDLLESTLEKMPE
jgi:uncharacterized protein YfeS